MIEQSNKPQVHLVRGGLLARNVLWNLFATGAPILIAVPAVPVLMRTIGTDRFGVLTMAWAVIGYASLFDLGLGRALTQLVSRKLGTGEQTDIPTLFWTSLFLMSLLGMVGMATIWASGSLLVRHVFKVPLALETETLHAFYLLGFAFPVVIIGAGLRGLLEAYQRFDLVSAVRVPAGVFTYAGPLLVLPFTKSLPAVIGVLVLGRVLTCLAHFWLCFRVVPELQQQIVWHRPSVRPLLTFGGWMSVSNIVGPLVTTLDRFVIAALVSLTAVAYYATPYELVSKYLLIPTAVVGVMFPAFSASYASDKFHAAVLYSRTVKYVFLVLFPVVLLTVALAQNGLTLWLGADFARHSTRVVQWLAVGMLVNSLALVPFSFVQGMGRPDLTAKLHIVELPLYLLSLYVLIRVDGIEGAAIAWTVRAAFDCIVLFLLVRRLLNVHAKIKVQVKTLLLAASPTLIVAILPVGLFLRVTFLLVAILGFALAAWYIILSPDERSFAQRCTLLYR